MGYNGVITTTITLPEEVKTSGSEKAKKDHKNFSEYIKDLIIKDLQEV